MPTRTPGIGLVLALGTSCALASACSRPPPDATPEGAVRLFVETMEASIDDPRAVRDAYALLGPLARENLAERARRTSHLQGRRVDPSEMLVAGRFGLRFRPKQLRANVVGDWATVDVSSGEAPHERAAVRCVREGGRWRIEPELPEVPPLQKRDPT